MFQFIFYIYNYIKSIINRNKILLVFDLNGFLIDRKFHKDCYYDEMSYATRIGSFYTWKRPHIDFFIDFTLKNFDVAVWSSAKSQNVQAQIDYIFNDRQKELIFIWNQDNCIVEARPDDTHSLFLKPINKILDNFPEYKNRIVFLDDSPEKLKYNGEYTYICPQQWVLTQQDDNILEKNGKLTKYLEKMLEHGDVYNYLKNNEY